MQTDTANGKPVATVLPAVTNPGLTLEQAQALYKKLKQESKQKSRHIHAVESIFTDKRGKNNPVLVVKTVDGDEYKPFTFGISKAKLLLAPGIMQAIQQFVSKHDGK